MNMKRSTIAVLCLALLTGCGQVDTVSSGTSTPEIAVAEVTVSDSQTPTGDELTASVTTATGSTGTATATTATTDNPNHIVTRSASQLTTKAGSSSTTKRTGSTIRTTGSGTYTGNGSSSGGSSSQQPQATSPATQPATSAPTDPPQQPTEIVPAENGSSVTSGDITCWTQDSGVTVTRDGKAIQTITIDSDALRFEDAAVTLNDYDFDGNADMFIPITISTLNNSGVFYRYDSESGLFEEWPEMEELSSWYTLEADPATGILNAYIRENGSDNESRAYEWGEDGELVLRHVRKLYTADDGETYCDYTDYSTGEAKLYKREHYIINEAGDLVSVEDVPLD